MRDDRSKDVAISVLSVLMILVVFSIALFCQLVLDHGEGSTGLTQTQVISQQEKVYEN